MTSAAAGTTRASLPQLSGRLLWSYRLTWCALAAGALLASGAACFQPASDHAVLGLRLVKTAVLVSVAAILLYRRQRDPVAALLALAFLTWTITSSFDFDTNAELAQLLDRFRFLLFQLALLLFPDARWSPGWTRWVAASSAGAFLIGVGEALHLLQTHLFLAIAIPCVLAGVSSLVVRFRRTADYTLRQQLKWVALGLVAGVGLILCARAGFTTSAGSPRMTVVWETIFQLGIIIVALGFLVSLLRYRLFDAETVISRSAVYAALTIALVATFGGTEAAIQNLGQEYLGMNIGGISGAMAAAVAAVLLSPLHERITDWAERRFQPDLVLLKREVPEIIIALVGKGGSTRQLASAVLPRINASIHATHSALLLGGRIAAARGLTMAEAQRWARRSLRRHSALPSRNSSDSRFPLRLPLGSPGSDSGAWLLLGPRPDGTLYGKEDLEAVRSFFPAFEQALSGARAREAVAATINRREERLRTEISQIHVRLSALELS